MESLSSIRRLSRRDTRPSALVAGRALREELFTALAIVLLAAVYLFSLTMLARRASGALDQNSHASWMIGTMFVAALLAAAIRALWCGNSARHSPLTNAIVLYAPLPAMLMASTAFSLPGLSATSLVWLIAAIEEFLALLLFGALPVPRSLRTASAWQKIERLRQVRPRGGRVIRAPLKTPARQRHDVAAPSPSEHSMQRTSLTAGDCVQSIERVQSLDGRDVLHGTFAARFVPGQVVGWVNVAFCPPFAIVPQVEFRQTAGPRATVKAGQILPHGARFDVKLAAPVEQGVLVTLEIHAEQSAC